MLKQSDRDNGSGRVQHDIRQFLDKLSPNSLFPSFVIVFFHMKKVFLPFGLILMLLLFSCVSMQEDIFIDNVSNVTEISEFEKRFTELDAQFFESEDVLKTKEFKNSCESLISDINRALGDVSLKKAVVARLYAISGCLYFDLGEKSQAKKNYDASVDAFKGDSRSIILAKRLAIESKIAEKVDADLPLLKLENALSSYSNMEYADALAKFDDAFLSLDGFYRNSYSKLRDKSWSLRNMGGNSELLSLKNINVMQMLLITNLNPDLLFNYTVGKELSNKDLYNKIAGSGLLNPVSKPLDAENAVTKDTPVTKLIAARFLWNLYNHNKNTPQNLTKYSNAYANKKRSPVTDVKLDSPDFDAALGCVENEIMHLEDGIEFGSEKELTAIEFNESIEKIK